jgi:hypothetical protein
MHSTARCAPFVLMFAAATAAIVFPVPQDADEPAPMVADGTDALLAELSRRSAIKQALVEDLATGRRSLADVAVRFAAMDVDRPGHTLVVQYYQGTTIGERYCRVVIGHVDAALSRDPRKCGVLIRLDAELARFIADGGRLPEVTGLP